MYNNEATAHGKLNLKSLPICWGIILGGYLLILSYIRTAAAPDRAGHLPCAAAVLLRGAVSMEVLQESGTAVLRAWHSAPGYCREADAVFPRSVSVRGQSVPCHGGHGGDRKGRTVCGTLYTDAHAVRSQPAVF